MNLSARYNAYRLTLAAMKAGEIQRQPCELCGAHAQAHHHDYEKPLDITWLCKTHHRQCHKENGKGKRFDAYTAARQEPCQSCETAENKSN